MGEKNLSCPQCGRRYEEPADRCRIDGNPLYGPEVMERVGATLGNYKFLSILGEGGMGVVYRGEHIVLCKPVAIKILHERFARREGSLEHLLQEARAASRIRHPHIIDVTDFGTASDGSVYFVMEFLEGESLEDVLARRRRIDLFGAINVGKQIANALAAAHDNRIVHLDLKPDNVFLISRTGRRRVVRRIADGDEDFVVEPEGVFDFVKLLDFGVARFVNDASSGAGERPAVVFGTPHYMSPEQARGLEVDGRSDIYSLGILLYEMILGEVPFDSENPTEILNAHITEAPVPPHERDPQIEIDRITNDTIMRCLAKSPDSRYQSMDELIEALQGCFTDRVFLRDVHRLPGAQAAVLSGEREVPRKKSAEASGRPPRSLTDDLRDLFTTTYQSTPDVPQDATPAQHASCTSTSTRPGVGAIRRHLSAESSTSAPDKS